MISELVYHTTPTSEISIKNLHGHLQLKETNNTLRLKTDPEINIGQLRVKSQQQETTPHTEHVFRNFRLGARIHNSRQKELQIAMTHLSTDWLKGSLSIEPVTFDPKRKSHAIIWHVCELNLKKLAKYWQIPGLDIS